MAHETGWIQTYRKKQFHVCDPRAEDVDIEDIAHALSNLCRFNGHTKRFYSVAQHSVHVSDECPTHRLEGLLHDAAEAYLCDLPRPLKLWLREQGITVFDETEDRLARVIAERFNLVYPWPPEVTAADNALLAMEARDLMAPYVAPWGCLEGVSAPFYDCIPWCPDVAKRMFLSLFKEITSKNSKEPDSCAGH